MCIDQCIGQIGVHTIIQQTVIRTVILQMSLRTIILLKIITPHQLLLRRILNTRYMLVPKTRDYAQYSASTFIYILLFVYCLFHFTYLLYIFTRIPILILSFSL